QISRGENVGAITLRHTYSADPGVRQRAPHECNVLKSGETNVGYELSTAAHEAIILLARQPGANALSGAGSVRGGKIQLIAHYDVPDQLAYDVFTPQRPAAGS